MSSEPGTPTGDAAAWLPERPTLERLREAAAECRGCGLWRPATQTVFGEGLKRARMMMVGEQPGDREDREGRPFVGPAGRELDRALEEAACRPWLDAELRQVKPKVLVCLGATAAQALLGRGFRVSRQRGQPVDSPLAPFVTATAHPSSILRATDREARERERRALVRDLRVAARAVPD